jgi:hypothetical protein
MANEFSTELVRIQLRTQALTECLPQGDTAAQNALTTLKRVLSLEDRYKGVEGWYAEHVPLFIQMQNCAQSIVTGKTLTQVRGNGLVATTTDRLRTNGNGLGNCFGTVEKFMGVVSKADRLVINKAVYPVAETMEQSKDMLHKMRDKLEARAIKIADIEAGTDKLTKEDADDLLIKGNWTDHKIRAYCIEYIARLFAFGIDEGEREALVKDSDYRLTDALDSLKPRFLTPAYA